MRRVIVIAAAGFSLAGCSSFSMDTFKSTRRTVQVQLDSTPPGADARTSSDRAARRPARSTVPVPDSGFSVTYTLEQVPAGHRAGAGGQVPGDFSTPASATVDPNPVVAELQPAGPPPKPARKKIMRPKKPKPPKSAPARCRRLGIPPFPQRAPAAAAPPPPPPPAADCLHCTRRQGAARCDCMRMA